MTREELLSELKNHECDILFTKKDGTERQLHCTLMESKLPPANPAKSTRKRSEDAISVWDLDSESWKAFRFDSIQTIAVNKGSHIEVTTQ